MTMHFPLERWEFFEAPINAAGDTVQIHEVWIDDQEHRIYGMSVAHFAPVWLSPKIVPGRVLRRDNSKPRHPLEWREIVKRGQAAITLDEDEKIAARVAAIPPPEVVARPATLEDMSQGCRTLGLHARKAGFTQMAMFSRGPRLYDNWTVAEISDCIQLKGWHKDGRRFVTVYITKTPGEGAKGAGIPKWENLAGYAWVQGVWVACGPTALESYFTNGSLTKEAP